MRELRADGTTVRLRLSGEVDALVKLAARHELVDLEIGRASLEEVFLSFYGRSEREATA